MSPIVLRLARLLQCFNNIFYSFTPHTPFLLVFLSYIRL